MKGAAPVESRGCGGRYRGIVWVLADAEGGKRSSCSFVRSLPVLCVDSVSWEWFRMSRWMRWLGKVRDGWVTAEAVMATGLWCAGASAPLDVGRAVLVAKE